MEISANLYADLERVLITREEIAASVRRLGKQITQDYAGSAPVVVCVLKGAALFYSDLIREIDLPITTDFMSASSYGSGTSPEHDVRIRKDLDQSVAGRDVILVEDIVDTGNTLHFLKGYLAGKGANSVKIATLLDKPARRKVDLRADYYCFTIPNAFVVGYGLDYDEKYRNLPDIGLLSPHIYENK